MDLTLLDDNNFLEKGCTAVQIAAVAEGSSCKSWIFYPVQGCNDAAVHHAVRMPLYGAKADSGEKAGTMWVAVQFTHKEWSQIVSPQTQQKKTSCGQPVWPPDPVCVPRSPLPLCPLQLAAPFPARFLPTFTLNAACVQYPTKEHDTALAFSSRFYCTEWVGYDFC